MKKALTAFVLLAAGMAWAPVLPRDAGPSSKTQDARVAKRIKVGGSVAQTNILERVQPEYPSLARQTRIQGTIKLHAIVGTDGTIKQLDVISGHPLLVQSALDAVRKWRYKPTLVNGEPVEVDTTIDVVFSLNEGPQPPPHAPIDPQLRTDILHLFEVMDFKGRSAEGGRAVFDSLRPMLLASLPATPNREKIVDAYMEKLLALLQSDDYRERIVAIYAKHFSGDDIKGITQFYQTPAGQHFNAVSSQLMGELAQVGQQLATENIPSILKELCKEYPELQGAINFCPKTEPDKKSLLFQQDLLLSGDRSRAAFGR